MIIIETIFTIFEVKSAFFYEAAVQYKNFAQAYNITVKYYKLSNETLVYFKRGLFKAR